MFDVENVWPVVTIEEAIAKLEQQPQARVIAGGTDALLKVRSGKWAGCPLVSIHDIASLRGVSLAESGAICIGPLTTFRQLENDPLIAARLPILAQAAASVGGPQIRAMGTVGGNLCNGATSADTASSLLALDAVLTLFGAGGSRIVPLKDFYRGPGQVDLHHSELLVMITINQPSYQNFGGCYLKYSMRNAMDIATLGTALLVRPDAARQRIDSLRLAFGVAGPTPLRCLETEQSLLGLSVDEAEQAIGRLVRAEIHPRTSWRASSDFRLQVAEENSRRALRAAWQQATDFAGGED